MGFGLFLIFWAFIFHIFWAYFILQTTHQKVWNQSKNQNILQTKTKTKTCYTEGLKPKSKPKGPKHTINHLNVFLYIYI